LNARRILEKRQVFQKPDFLTLRLSSAGYNMLEYVQGSIQSKAVFFKTVGF